VSAERPPAGDGILDLVARDDREGVARLLAQHPAAARGRGSDGVSVLLHAVYRGRREIAELLDAAGAERDIFNSAALGRCDRLEAVLDADAGAHRALSADGWTALHLAAFFGHADAVRLLLRRGADPRVLSRNGQENHPLHAACAGSREEAALALIEAGADIDWSARGYTPLLLAAANGLQPVVEALLLEGADPGVRDPAGRTARELARIGGHDAVVDLLARARS
jgi:ankyrin repeat protein